MDINEQEFAEFLKDAYGLYLQGTEAFEAYYDVTLRLDTAQGQFFTKIHYHDSADRVEAIATLMDHWQESGIPIAEIQKSKSGDIVTEFDGKPVIVQEFVQASLIKDADYTKELMRDAGRTLGKMHKASESLGESIQKDMVNETAWNAENFDLLLEHYEEIKSRFSDRFKKIIEGMADEWEERKEALESCRRGYIHNDYNGANVMAKDDEIKAVIDFSDAVHSWYITDVANALHYLTITEKDEWASTKDFFEGYQEEFPLTEKEIEQIPFLIKARAATSLIENIIDRDFEREDCIRALHKLAESKNIDRIMGYLNPDAPKKNRDADVRSL